INEPILFGMPIIMNPLFFLPFILVPMINAVFAWTATKLGWVAQVVSMAPWTTPAPIGASWAANWAFSPVIMCLFCMMLSALIYLPFVKAWERSLLRQEQEAQAQQAAAAPGAGLQTP
ncbi:MAG: PTS sugar transporter subunit IIC, partial [Mixta calida]|nr:PTS sugar transporter subunit IIC [Mixta calida]